MAQQTSLEIQSKVQALAVLSQRNRAPELHLLHVESQLFASVIEPI